MMGHKIMFYGGIRLIIPISSLLPLLIWSTGFKCFICRLSGETMQTVIRLLKEQSDCVYILC